MIILEPNWDEINVLPTPLTAGERNFIERIEALYGDDDVRNLEVFVQANINADRPDIIVVERGSGIWIVEVKDWNLNLYEIDKEKWYVQVDNRKQLIKSPFQQAERYKKNIFSLHSHYLATRKLGNSGVYGLVRCGVYFHCATEKTAVEYKDKEYGSNNKGRFMKAFGHDTKDQEINNFFRPPNSRIQEDEYNHLMRFIRASEEAYPIRNVVYNAKQLSLIKSAPKRQKVKGVAGSGKSLVLAARAVNALERTKGKILIITFNITLMNYLHDRISEVRGTYRRKDFNIISYHAFINAECNNYGIPTGEKGDFISENTHYKDMNLFEMCKESIDKYDAIFIDEIQDFEYEWQQILLKYFLKVNGEFVLFGDEKQNVYDRKLEDKKIRTVVPGAWNTLPQSYRLAKQTAILADAYQKYFFRDRYEVDQLYSQLEFDFTDEAAGGIQYFYTHNSLEILSEVEKFVVKSSIHPNDIVYLGCYKSTMRHIDAALRRSGENTTTMFISLEEHQDLVNNHPNEMEQIESEIERARKVGFWMNTGCVKLSTIQSFKGWEANTIILIIPAKCAENMTIDELIYTGLTRCKKNLIIINEGNLRMHNFFSQERNIFNTFNSVVAQGE